jgi:hypothetical protein
VASFVPLAFWRATRKAVAEVNPGCVWLAESVHLSFGNFARREGFTSTRDSEAFDAFDIEYQYDVWECFERFLRGEGLLHEFCEQLNFQEALYREGYNNRECENPNLAEAIVLKNRKGQTGTVNLTWVPEYTTFYSVEKYRDDE